MSDERLRLLVDADQRRLVEIASQEGGGPLADAEAETELREIANRLPRLQRELDRRTGGGSNERVIR